jgi:hypothetical protein
MLNGSGDAPDITVTDINGNTHNLYNYLDSGYVMVLELLSTTCGHCQSHAIGTENSYLANGPGGTNTARFLGLEVNPSTDSTTVANFASAYGVGFPIANNISPANINYQLSYTPTYYVIYPDKSYTTICANCITVQNYSTIEVLLNSAIQSWLPPINGCTDPNADNYDSSATYDDGNCIYYQTWNQVSNFISSGRHHPITFGNDDFGFVMSGSYLEDVYKYDKVNDTWTQLQDIPFSGRGYSYGVSNGDKAYMGFGSTSNNTFPTDWWEYDMDNDSWIQLANFPGDGRQHPAMIVVNDNIYMGCGGNGNGNLGDWWEYNITLDTWTQKK